MWPESIRSVQNIIQIYTINYTFLEVREVNLFNNILRRNSKRSYNTVVFNADSFSPQQTLTEYKIHGYLSINMASIQEGFCTGHRGKS